MEKWEIHEAQTHILKRTYDDSVVLLSMSHIAGGWVITEKKTNINGISTLQQMFIPEEMHNCMTADLAVDSLKNSVE